MRYIDSTSIGAISNMVKTGKSLPRGAGVYSLLFGAAGLKTMSRAKRKKLGRRRFRMFVDNIIMHHKRLHDRNRQITIDLVSKNLNKKEKDRKKEKRERELRAKNKWRQKYAKDNRALEIKERINARRIRAKSGWVAMMEERRSKELPK